MGSAGPHRAMRRMSGNLILESWNCLMLTRLQAAAGTVAVLMICMHGARTRCRDAISCAHRAHGDQLSSASKALQAHLDTRPLCSARSYNAPLPRPAARPDGPLTASLNDKQTHKKVDCASRHPRQESRAASAPGTAAPPRRSAWCPGTPCTCCGSPCATGSAPTRQSSSPWWGASQRSARRWRVVTRRKKTGGAFWATSKAHI